MSVSVPLPHLVETNAELLGSSIGLLVTGDVVGAASAFRVTLGLDIQGADTPVGERSGAISNADVAALLELLRTVHADDVSWWRKVSEQWQQVAMAATSRACALRGRRLAAMGLTTRWEDLTALSLLARRPAAPSGSSGPTREASGARIAPEPRSDKTQRMLLLWGRGDRARVRERLDRLRKEPPSARDLTAILLCITGGQSPQLYRYFRLEMWHFAGEHRAAIEEFFATIHGSSLMGWLDDDAAQVGAYLCGVSLLALGDAVSAYACFYLATLFYTKPEGAASESSSTEYLQLAATEAERLSWAAECLHDTDSRFFLHAQGWRTLSWFSEHGIAGRWWRYDEAASGLRELYPIRISRAIAPVARRNGWLMSELTDLPRLLPSDQALHPPRALPAARDSAPPGAARLAQLASPPRLRFAQAPTPASRAARFRIGFMKGADLKHTEEHIRLEPGHIGLALGTAADDHLVASIAHQLADDGWSVLWLRRPSQHDAPQSVGPSVSDLVRLRPGNDFTPLGRGFLADVAADHMLRRSVAAYMAATVGGTASSLVAACMNALLMHAHKNDLWEIMTSERHGSSRAAAQIVSSELDLDLRSPTDLRRAALRIRIMTRAVDLLAAALRIACIRPESDVKRRGMLVDLPGSATGPEALLGLLAAGSLLRSAERDPDLVRDDDAAPAVTDLEDFELSPRPRPPGLSSERVRALLRRAERAEPDPPNPWRTEGLLASGGRAQLCIIASETLGDDWPVIARWIRSGRFARRHVLLGASRSAHPSLLTHEMIGEATLFLLGPLCDEARARFRIVTGTSPADHARTANEALLLRMGPAAVERRQFVLWPPP
jgi:hypothetical protein